MAKAMKKKASLYDKEQHLIFNHEAFVVSDEVTEQQLKEEEEKRLAFKSKRRQTLAERE